MSELLTQAVDICRKLIGEKTTPEINEIEAAITNITYMPLFKDIDQSILKEMLLSLYTTKVDTFQILEGKERREPWLKAFKAAQISKWSFWMRYKKYLAEKKSFAPSVISHLDELTDKVLDKLFNPQQEDIIISKKGLVVGQVQSGKTANYTGLVCKAADAGFNLIIVLAGIHNNLRSQTQTRLDEGFLGFDTQNTRACTLNQTIKMGVGRIPGFDDAIAHSYTTSLDTGDFTKRAANTAGFNFYVPQPIVLVVKKNSSVLKNLRDWLKTHTTAGKISVKSMLLIDDEADNASVNTNKADKDPTRINGYIRDILGQFNRSAYVGYTATGTIWGSILATFAVILPSLIIMLSICRLYLWLNTHFQNNLYWTQTLRMLRFVVIGLIAAAALLLMRPTTFIDSTSWGIFAFVALCSLMSKNNQLTSFLSHPIVLIVVAGIAGYFIYT